VALDVYRKKRRFGVTPEPRGRKAVRGDFRYVIQKHAARRLHYDLRLELDGVMKSWAVTRGPSLDPSEKRLAVQVEDHPIEYNSFEGTIPQGEYGGGTVMIWDRGRWAPEGDPQEGLAKGHLDFELQGKKLRGRWHLVRLRSRPNDRADNWLLIKGKDEYARGSGDKDILEKMPSSAATGRTMGEIAAGKGRKRVWHSNRAEPNADGKKAFKERIKKLAQKSPAKTRTKAQPAAARSRLKTSATPSTQRDKARLPDFVPVSLATLRENPPGGPDWLHEIKYDGYRIEARLDRGRVRLLTRREQDWTHRFPPIAAAVGNLAADTALLDGELVVENDRGISNFSLLQIALKEGRTDRFGYYVFDLLHLDGRDLTPEPLVERKAALQRLIKKSDDTGPISYAEHFDEEGPILLRHACEMKLEGIVSKLKTAPYRSGRSENFIKSKCHDRQELVVVGFTRSTAMPKAIGALTVAYYDNGELRYAGRIGTGYTHQTARDLWKRLEGLHTDRPPVAVPEDERRKNVIWVKPQTVIEAEFRGWTHDRLLRQAAFKGLREDKPPREVVREMPATPHPPPAVRSAATARTAAAAKRTRAVVSDPPPARAGKERNDEAASDMTGIHLTHPDKVYWPDAGISKRDLAEYYVEIWDWMRPQVTDRALAIVRGPEGIGGEMFFQKHIGANVKSSPLRHAVASKEHDVIAVQTLDDMLALVQSGALEIHVRGSRLENLELCDRIVFDLDPGEGVAWRDIVAAAREVRQRLQSFKLESFVKLTGGKGIHVVLPIAGTDWDSVKSFGEQLSAAMVADSPQLYVGKMTKALRGGHIFIDYFRNSREATAVAPYSTRARPGAPVSAPVTWERLSRTNGGNDFTLRDAKKRLRSDAWDDIGKLRQTLPTLAPQRRG
jgi:bifunctional non-homologous end joining protein LigD